MKTINVRYILKGRNLQTTERINKESISAEISGSFCELINDVKKYNKFQLSLECKILPIHFGLAENNFVFDAMTFNKFSKVNSGVKTKMGLLQNALNELDSFYGINNYQPTAKEFKKELFIKLKRTDRVVPKTYTILEFLQKKITEFENNVGSAQKGIIKPNTIKSYVTLSKYIAKYETVRNVKLTFDNFDKKTYKDFWVVQDEILSGSITIPKIEGDRKQQIKPNGFSINGIVKYQKTFGKVLRLAVDEKIKIAIDLKDESLVLVETESAKEIYINETELQKIINYQPTTNELKIAKDYSIIASLTGMRNESMRDAYGVKIETFKDSSHNFKYIHSKHNKTGTECFIPLLAPVQDVIKTNNNQFPNFPDNGTTNRLLKELFLELEINATETLTYHTFTKGVITEKKQVNEIISTHDFKGTFYSNLSNLKVNETQIDDITHPDKPKKNAMAKFYDKRGMLSKAKLFVDEVNRVNKLKESKVYHF